MRRCFVETEDLTQREAWFHKWSENIIFNNERLEKSILGLIEYLDDHSVELVAPSRITFITQPGNTEEKSDEETLDYYGKKIEPGDIVRQIGTNKVFIVTRTLNSMIVVLDRECKTKMMMAVGVYGTKSHVRGTIVEVPEFFDNFDACVIK